MHQIQTVSQSYRDGSDSLRNNVGDLSGPGLKECHNVVLNTADTADSILIYTTQSCGTLCGSWITQIPI